jgi:TRAP-type C4-dicarboxylate transport system permease small subunit
MSLLKSFTNKLNLSIKYFCVLLFIVMIVSSFGQVISRYIFEYSLSWSEELARYAAIWLTFMGATVALKEKALAYVEAFINMLPGKISRWVGLFVNALNLTFCSMMLVYGYELVVKTAGQTSPALTLPMVLVYAAAPVSGMLMILYIIEFLMIDYLGKNHQMEA